MPFKKIFLSVVLLIMSLANGFAQTDTTDVPVKPQLPTGPPGAPPPPTVRPAPPLAPAPPQPVFIDSIDEEDEVKQIVTNRRFFLGGSGGLSFSSDNYYGDQFFVEVSPFLGYRLSDRVSAGPGFTYQFINTGIFGKFHNYGFKFFGQGTVFKSVFSDSDQLMLHAEYEVLNVEVIDFNTYPNLQRMRVNLSSVLGGLAYRQNISDRVATDLYILYNFTNDGYSPYGPLVIRAAFLVDL